MNAKKILVINCGSSSVKAAFFAANKKRRDFFYANIGQEKFPTHVSAIQNLFYELSNETIDAIGHRIVHGGAIKEPIRLIEEKEFSRLKSLIPLASFHMKNNIVGIKECAKYFKVPQYACFDTAFHRNMPLLARRLPLPTSWQMERYGFHGISYAYIAQLLPKLLGQQAYGYIVVAHLGSGSSLCLLHRLKSVDTTMGLTPLGGVVMSTRSGDIDPGVILQLMHQDSVKKLTTKLYTQCGLLALSGGKTADMETLLNSTDQESQFAVTYYCNSIRAAIGGFAAKAGKINALIFTGGIGENADKIRAKICDTLGLLGFILDKNANRTHQQFINAPSSKPILCIPTDEQKIIFNWVKRA